VGGFRLRFNLNAFLIASHFACRPLICDAVKPAMGSDHRDRNLAVGAPRLQRIIIMRHDVSDHFCGLRYLLG
jgi:hypothetical protein